MNQKKAKVLRKKVYGDFSLRTQRTYKTDNKTIIGIGLRRVYQDAKKLYKGKTEKERSGVSDTRKLFSGEATPQVL